MKKFLNLALAFASMTLISSLRTADASNLNGCAKIHAALAQQLNHREVEWLTVASMENEQNLKSFLKWVVESGETEAIQRAFFRIFERIAHGAEAAKPHSNGFPISIAYQKVLAEFGISFVSRRYGNSEILFAGTRANSIGIKLLRNNALFDFIHNTNCFLGSVFLMGGRAVVLNQIRKSADPHVSVGIPMISDSFSVSPVDNTILDRWHELGGALSRAGEIQALIEAFDPRLATPDEDFASEFEKVPDSKNKWVIKPEYLKLVHDRYYESRRHQTTLDASAIHLFQR